MYHPAWTGWAPRSEALERVQLFRGLDRTSAWSARHRARTRLPDAPRSCSTRGSGDVAVHRDTVQSRSRAAVEGGRRGHPGDAVRPGALFGSWPLLDGAPRFGAQRSLWRRLKPRCRAIDFGLINTREPGHRDAQLAGSSGRVAPPGNDLRFEEPHFRTWTGRMAARLLRPAQGAGAAADTEASGRWLAHPGATSPSMIGATRQSVNKPPFGQFDGMSQSGSTRDASRHHRPARARADRSTTAECHVNAVLRGAGRAWPPVGALRAFHRSLRVTSRAARRPPRSPRAIVRGRQPGRPATPTDGATGPAIATETAVTRAARPCDDSEAEIGPSDGADLFPPA